ncbi:hypothetical protein JNUCC1_02875 [Lentibacillus sp. JNUCC-1]|nr:hypothetical protein [Lentibacillus sp. JNUCC-1]
MNLVELEPIKKTAYMIDTADDTYEYGITSKNAHKLNGVRFKFYVYKMLLTSIETY